MLDSIKKSILVTAMVLTASAGAFAAKKPLTVWIMPNGASPQETLEQRLEKFTKNTGIPTKVQVLDWGEAWSRISRTLSGDQEAPDVLQLGTTWIPYFASRNEIKPLNSLLTEADRDRFVPVSWATTHIDGDTTIYSLPWFIDIRAVLANKRILKEHNVTKESLATYEGFVEAVKQIENAKETLKDGTPVHGYAFPGKSDWNIPHNFAPWIWSNGGSFIKKNEAGKWHANILSRETLLGISRYLNFVLDSLVPAEALQTNTAQVAQQFNNGELAFIVSTSEIIMQTRFHGSQGGLANAQIGKDGIVAIPIPSGAAGSVSFIGGSNLAIPAKNNRKEAKDLLFFLLNDETLDVYTKQIGMLPSSKKVLEAWAQDEDYRVLVNALATGKTYKAIPEWGELEQQLVSLFTSVWEQVEIPSLYSQDKLYEVFKRHTIDINTKLGVPDEKIMSQDEFNSIWNEINGKATVKTDSVNSSNNISDNEKATIVNDNLKKAPLVFVVMLILGFVFNFRRKSKK